MIHDIFTDPWERLIRMGKVVGKYTVDPSIDPTLNFVCLVGDFLRIPSSPLNLDTIFGEYVFHLPPFPTKSKMKKWKFWWSEVSDARCRFQKMFFYPDPWRCFIQFDDCA